MQSSHLGPKHTSFPLQIVTVFSLNILTIYSGSVCIFLVLAYYGAWVPGSDREIPETEKFSFVGSELCTVVGVEPILITLWPVAFLFTEFIVVS